MRCHKLAIGVGVSAVLAVAGLGVPGGLTSRAEASAATTARGTLGAALAVPRPPGGRPVFDATFRGTRLNTKIWATCYPGASRLGCTNFGNRTEAEWYLRSQVSVSGGVVHLIARRRRTIGTTSTGARKVYGCRSGMITSYPGFKFKYGFVQVVAEIPHATGLWPALWLAAANRRSRPEIDMVESWGVDIRTVSVYHPVRGKSLAHYYPPRLTRGWQTYSLYWSRSRLEYYVGSRLMLTVKRDVPEQRMYFLADLAEYKPARRGDCTGQLMIRSVKVWRL